MLFYAIAILVIAALCPGKVNTVMQYLSNYLSKYWCNSVKGRLESFPEALYRKACS